MSDQSVHCVVTSPPYWGLRDYGTANWDGGDSDCEHTVSHNDADGKAVFDGRVSRGDRSKCIKCGAVRVDSQLGLEATPEEFVENMVEVFREVRRVLRDDGTCWVNLGDTYYGGGGHGGVSENNKGFQAKMVRDDEDRSKQMGFSYSYRNKKRDDLKPKDLVGI
ncbi:MAG: hypothetical protein HOC79_00900, partial [Euryarchaeota archaeon]|nr:hypothetical protein [Euryarchaeota archaeon]